MVRASWRWNIDLSVQQMLQAQCEKKKELLLLVAI